MPGMYYEWRLWLEDNEPVLLSTIGSEKWVTSERSISKRALQVAGRLNSSVPKGEVLVAGFIEVNETGEEIHGTIKALRVISHPKAHAALAYNITPTIRKVLYCYHNNPKFDSKCERVELAELEERLLKRYDVPRAHENVGSWK